MNVGDKFVTELLNLEPLGDNVFRGERVFTPNPRTIYGGELMAQALMAASKTVKEDFRPNSLHCYFHDRCSVKLANHYRVQSLRDGHSFCHRLVEAFPSSDENAKPYFRMDCSFKVPEQDPASFISKMPNVPSVNLVHDFKTYIKTLNIENLPPVPHNRVQQFSNFDDNSPIEIKFCEPDYVLGLKSNSEGRLHAWIRLKEAPSVSLNSYRDAMLAYLSDALLLWVAVTEPHPVYYLVTLNQSIWFHNPDICPEPNEWLLFETNANYVGGALTLSYGAMWDQKGNLLASMAQQGLMRTQKLPPVASYTAIEKMIDSK